MEIRRSLMRVCNIIFKDFDQLRRELIAHNVQKVSKEQFFVQIFMGVADKNIAKELLDFFDTALDCRVLLVQSGRETIVSGNIFSSQILISISCFSHSTLKRAYYPADRDIDEIARDIRENLASEKTKLLVVFIACGSFYHQDLLGAIKKELPSLLLCGGRSHPYDMGTMQGLIGDNDGIYDHGMICLSIDSEILSVQSDFVFGWEDIGLPLKITKSQHNIVYEINHKKAIEVFEHYLGKTALENLHSTTYIFPLIYRVNGVPIARVAMKICQDGSVVFNDNIPEGTEVKFGFGLMENISRNTELAYAKIPKNFEGIYMYSCIGHLMFSGKEGMESILKIFRDEPALCGFFTFGEIYSCRDQNVFLGLTNTFYCLCEGDFEESQKPSLQKARANLDKGTLVMSTLANLMHRVNQEVMEVTKNFETYYEFVDELMFHIIADAELNILYSNKRISQVSLYDFSQVQGKNCLEFVDAQTREEITHRILPILAEKGQWSGKIYQYRKDGTPYYVKMIIKAIKDREGNVMRYIIGQMDDTADELKRMALESESIFLKRSDEERRYLLDQYQSILDKNQSFFRLDLNRNFIYGNEIFLKITGLKLEEILGKNIYDFIPVNEQRQFDKISKDLVEKGYYEGVLEYTRKDGKKVYIQSAAYFIKDLNDIPFEIIAVGVEITQIIEGVKEIESIQKDVIYSMGAICEGKSRETGNHIIRVAEYSALLAELCGCSKEDQELLRIASPMHDIGKVGISDAILNKSGKLTPEEFEIMKTHTTIGEEIFKNSNRLILRAAGEIAGSHHEWWNGEGYPRGIQGEEIPLFGRITALADVFDALSNDRCYKKAWPLPKVLEYVKSLRGKQFQPELLDLFLENLDRFLEIGKKYQDKNSSSLFAQKEESCGGGGALNTLVALTTASLTLL